jgi:ketosteroid isomerase-like protein
MLRRPARSRIRQTFILFWVRRSWEIVNRRDFELALAAQDPDVLVRFAPDPRGRIPPDMAGEFRGRDGFSRAWDAWLEAFEDLRVEPEEFTDLGGDRLLVVVRAVGSGTESGVLAETHGYMLYTFRAGRVLSHEFFAEREQAEAAAGVTRAG